jgi:basic membrane protein A
MRGKLILLGVVVGALALVGAGCGGSDDEGSDGSDGALRVALSVDAGQLDDEGFVELSHKGLTRAENELGTRGRVFEAQSPQDYVPNMTAAARQGYDLVIGVGYAQGDAIATVAKAFPDVDFAIVDVGHENLKGSPQNAVGLLFREEQVGYLAGYLAALAQDRDGGEPTISAVGGYKEPGVDRFIAGYIAGADAAVPGTEVIYSYSQDWEDQAKCKELALRQIARGAGVVFQVAGECGLGALSAARDKGVWGIGVDADQSFLGPHVLTSALKGVDQAVFLTIESVLDGSFTGGGDVVFGLEEDGVGLGTISPEVPEEDVQAVDDVKQQIADGEIADIPTTLD